MQNKRLERELTAFYLGDYEEAFAALALDLDTLPTYSSARRDYSKAQRFARRFNEEAGGPTTSAQYRRTPITNYSDAVAHVTTLALASQNHDKINAGFAALVDAKEHAQLAALQADADHIINHFDNVARDTAARLAELWENVPEGIYTLQQAAHHGVAIEEMTELEKHVRTWQLLAQTVGVLVEHGIIDTEADLPNVHAASFLVADYDAYRAASIGKNSTLGIIDGLTATTAGFVRNPLSVTPLKDTEVDALERAAWNEHLRLERIRDTMPRTKKAKAIIRR